MDSSGIKINVLEKHPLAKDILSLILFVIAVIIGTLGLNAYVFRSYNVVGISMENTLHQSDRVIVNRLPVTWEHFLGNEYIPSRGQIIVFANGPADGPLTCQVQSGVDDQYIIKRVIAFPGERVVVKNGVMTVYQWDNDKNDWNDGTVYDKEWRISENDGPKEHTSGDIDMVVPEGELFVSGDNREGNHSWDSRNGLGTIPYCRIVGPVIMRLFPFDKMRGF